MFYRVAKRWIAGYTLEDVIRVAHEINDRRIRVIINRLGEHTPDRKLVQEYTQEYLRVLDRVEKEGVQGSISVKPSQLGLAISPSTFKENLNTVLDRAQDGGRFVWVDMENSPYTDGTLQVYAELYKGNSELGVCVQANMKRTEKDLETILSFGGKVRLVKGAYPESSEVAYRKRSMVDQSYKALMRMLFSRGHWFGIATHDEKMIAEAERLGREAGKNFEFQMLKGVRDDLKEKLVGQGYTVSDYVPYGPEWYNYSKRRLRERKRNILLLVRSITG